MFVIGIAMSEYRQTLFVVLGIAMLEYRQTLFVVLEYR